MKDSDSVVFFVMFVLPGLISVRVRELRMPVEERDYAKLLLNIAAFSAVNYIVLVFPIILFAQWLAPALVSQLSDMAVAVLVGLVSMLGAVIVPVALERLVSWMFARGFAKMHSAKTAWSYVFSSRRGEWVIVHLRDGRLIGGRCSDNSFASSYPRAPEIYIEETWAITEKGEWKHRVPNSNGIIILDSEIAMVEFFEGT